MLREIHQNLQLWNALFIPMRLQWREVLKALLEHDSRVRFVFVTLCVFWHVVFLSFLYFSPLMMFKFDMLDICTHTSFNI